MIYRFSFFLVAAFIIASQPLQAKEFKVGVIDMPRALNETTEGEKIVEEMKLKISKENEELQKKEEELKRMQDAITKQGFLLSESARIEKEEQFSRLKRERDRFREDKQAEFLRMQRRATERIHQGLMKVLNEYAKRENYDLIVEAGQQAAGIPGFIVYFDETLDITDRIIELYNKKAGEKAEKK